MPEKPEELSWPETKIVGFSLAGGGGGGEDEQHTRASCAGCPEPDSQVQW